MTLPSRLPGRLAALAAALLCSSGAGATAAEQPASSKASAAIFPGTNSKEPISIDADKLEYFDKEQKAIYTGNVIAIQGESKLTCSVMTLFLAKSGPQPAAGAPATGAAPGSGGTQVKHMDATGPVTVVSKTQVATGDRGSYDKDENKVWLFGNVTLSDGGNVTKGDKLTYDLKNGLAIVDTSAKSGRVHGQFVPKSNGDAKSGGDAKADAAKPK